MARMIVAPKCRLFAACRTPVRMALISRSAGKLSVPLRGERHHNRAAMAVALQAAKIQNGAAIPTPAMATPPRAGPTARLIL